MKILLYHSNEEKLIRGVNIIFHVKKPNQRLNQKLRPKLQESKNWSKEHHEGVKQIYEDTLNILGEQCEENGLQASLKMNADWENHFLCFAAENSDAIHEI